jgi:hypothetical protein
MNTTPLNARLAAAAASVVITFSLLSGIAAMAKPPVGSVHIAQAVSAVAG